MDVVTADRRLRGWSLANLIANTLIVWTGALVRLTKSGLGCNTWPQCQAGSFVPVPESGVHGVIEFTNRTLTFILIAIVIGFFVSARRAVREGRAPKRLVGLVTAVAIGIIAQAVIGGVSVLLQLNPWVVGLHMFVTVILLVISVEAMHIAYKLEPIDAGPAPRALANAVFWLGMIAVYLGTIVTGSGPNAGDGAATRNGFDILWTARAHAWTIWIVVALTIVGIFVTQAHSRARRLFASVLAVELLQGAIGYIQFFNGLPLGVIFAHMVGTTLFIIAVAHLWQLVGTHPDASTPAS